MRAVMMLALMACGQGAPSSPDAPLQPDAPAAIPNLEASYVFGPITADHFTGTVSARPGDIFVVSVLLAQPSAGVSVSNIVAGRPLWAWLQNVTPSCAQTSETWVLPRQAADAVDELVISLSRSTTFTAYVLQFSGVTAPMLTTSGGGRTSDAGSITAMQLEADRPGQLVVSTMTVCSPLGAVASPFASMNSFGVEDVAYYITESPGMYGATWSFTGSTQPNTIDANTILFHR